MKIRLFTIPNFITLGNLCCGAMAVVSALVWDNLTVAASLLVAAAVCDFFDGMVARLLGISGPLGVQLDSLADDISFGLAPSMMLYVLFERVNGGLLPAWTGYLVFLFAAFAALRLAKFNIDEEQKTEFRGLPTPAATLVVLSLAVLMEQGETAWMTGWMVLAIAVVLSLLMVSNIPMLSLKFKSLALKGNEQRYGLIALFVVLVVVWSPLYALLSTMVLYILFSAVQSLAKRSKR
ncbi:MAG: CDP-diacylglycerol--serine O-phosphatidyltransferase [Rikenellaceae bacterium]|nr:CDP-diacylglycerol--serine O-phosphatidyltransferase [Rikenellaceae bacterium]